MIDREAREYAGRSAQKINSRARGAITSRRTRTLARNSSITSHETCQSPRTHLSLAAGTPRHPLGEISNRIPDESEGRRPISSVRTLSRGDFEVVQ